MSTNDLDLSKWWGPHEVGRHLEPSEHVRELRCGFCGRYPQIGEMIYGIADLLWHFDYQYCQKESE